MAVGIKISLNDKLYLRDPQETTLGQRLIRESIILIDEIDLKPLILKSWLTKWSHPNHLYIAILRINTIY